MLRSPIKANLKPPLKDCLFLVRFKKSTTFLILGIKISQGNSLGRGVYCRVCSRQGQSIPTVNSPTPFRGIPKVYDIPYFGAKNLSREFPWRGVTVGYDKWLIQRKTGHLAFRSHLLKTNLQENPKELNAKRTAKRKAHITFM